MMACNWGLARKKSFKNAVGISGKLPPRVQQACATPSLKGLAQGGGKARSQPAEIQAQCLETHFFPRKGNVRSENFQPEGCFPREDFHLTPQATSDALLASSAGVRALGACPRRAGDAEPGGTELLNSLAMP